MRGRVTGGGKRQTTMRGGLGTVAKMTKRTTVQARGGSIPVGWGTFVTDTDEFIILLATNNTKQKRIFLRHNFSTKRQAKEKEEKQFCTNREFPNGLVIKNKTKKRYYFDMAGLPDIKELYVNKNTLSTLDPTRTFCVPGFKYTQYLHWVQDTVIVECENLTLDNISDINFDDLINKLTQVIDILANFKPNTNTEPIEPNDEQIDIEQIKKSLANFDNNIKTLFNTYKVSTFAFTQSQRSKNKLIGKLYELRTKLLAITNQITTMSQTNEILTKIDSRNVDNFESCNKAKSVTDCNLRILPYSLLFTDINEGNTFHWVKCIEKSDDDITKAVSTWNKQNKQKATEKQIAMVDCIKDPEKRQHWNEATSSDTLNQMIADIQLLKAKMQPYSVLFETIDFDNISDWSKCTEKSDADINDAINDAIRKNQLPDNEYLNVMVDLIKVSDTRQQWNAATTLNALNELLDAKQKTQSSTSTNTPQMTPQTKPSPTTT